MTTTKSQRWLSTYVGSVIIIGLGLLIVAAPSVLEQPYPVAALLGLAAALSALKIHVPLARGWATMSTSFAALFVAMLTVGFGPALVIAAVSGWVQSAFHAKTNQPLWRHLFNSMMLVLSVAAAGSAFLTLGGQLGKYTEALHYMPLVGATSAYFLANSLIVSTAVAISTGQPWWPCWHDNFLWTAPGYFLTAGFVAAGAGVVKWAPLLVQYDVWQIILFIAVPIGFIYHSYKVYFGRLHAEQKRVMEMAQLEATAREGLAAEKERLAVTLRSIGDAVITTDLQGRVTMLNVVASRLTGRTEEKAIGKSIDDVLCLWDPEGMTVQEVPILRILETGRMPDSETNASLIAPDGSRLSVSLTGAPIYDADEETSDQPTAASTIIAATAPDGSPSTDERKPQKIGVALVVRDITESVRLMQERVRASKLESLGVLAGGIAHDFNNVLTAVVGNIALARSDETLSRETAQWLEEAERACLRARTLTHQLLTFSRGGDPVKRPMHVGHLVDATTRFAVSGSNVRCVIDLAPDLWAVEADEGQIEQVVHNIVLNAKQAMTRGGNVQVVCGNVRMAPGPEPLAVPRQYVRISIKDSGPGIPPEHLERIFDPYFTTKPSGTGLGLAVSHAVIKNHGGLLHAESVVGSGTTFHILLPRSFKRVAATTTTPTVATPHGRGRVLVMDDDRSIATVTASMLKSLGYTPDIVSDGEMAIERYLQARDAGEPFEAVVMDLTVPGGMGGAEALAQLRQYDPRVCAIVMSGYADTGLLAEYQSVGFAGRLAKPFSLRDLAVTLHDLLADARRRVPN
ncbi:MAG TPA: ATP-binding protein [Luteitalea sp.]|nr:ATP-binding protein [Luteitalea sp.]